MKSFCRSIMLLLAVPLLAVACAGDDAPPGDGTSPTPDGNPSPTSPAGPGDFARADVPHARVTDVGDAELADLVAGDSEFAFELFRLAAAEGGNTLISPYSIAAALTMTYAGARGTTADEMGDVLHVGLSGDRLHTARNELDLRITATPDPSPGDERAPFTIEVANSLWGQQGYPFLSEFLELLAENYDAGMNLVDFVNAAEEARQQINAWVEDRTAGRIVDLIPEGAVNDLTRLVLVNAIWFKANWAHQFDPDLTADATFTTLAGSRITVPMMRQQERFTYAEGDGYRAVRLPYAGDASMVIILPDDGRFEDIGDSLGPETLQSIRSREGVHSVDLSMPRFEFRSQFGLKQALKDLGMVAAFTEPSRPDGADLTGMTEARELYVKDVIHQAFIKVDEQGTEAAAATAVIVGVESLPPPATLTLDRPFLFVIEHGATGEILFLGQVVDPS